jgi:hypothetical protein
VGILSAESFISIFSLPYTPKNISLDISRSALIIDQGDVSQYISSLDGSRSLVFPFDEPILIADITNEMILTRSGSSTRRGDRWIKNTRFTDVIALPNGNLLGYIDKSDREKLALQNYPLGTSLIVEIDRTTTRVSILKT